ncbi:hypothetical protein N8T08_005404 [Aspergillus melleus]|uniref:Uncharacterized protein n=1 Tax=Aspergillus melleus TaxID=138277 RepID=A0ACC3B3Q9_9EURO|nr:hypothetical protein N8T08_005404 [Aspergillus melleus]
MGSILPTDQVLNIAVAGLGRMGKRHVHTLVGRVPRAKVVAVCSTWDNEVQWAEETYKGTGIQVFSSYEDMIQLPSLNAVWISTSTDVHASQTLTAINKGLHVLCEKPLSTDLAEAQHVVDVANAHPELKVMAGYSRRFDASYRAAKDHLAGIGAPFVVRSQTCDLLDDTGFFVRYAARNGGIFVDCCIHDIDLSLYYMGEDLVPKSAYAVGSLQHHPELGPLQDVDNGVGIVEYWGGKMAYFYCSRTQAHGHDVCTEITGTKGKIMVNLIPRSNHVQVAGANGISNAVPEEYWQRFEDAFATEANEFVASVLDDKPVPVKLELGVKGIIIGRALQDSLLSGEVVKFNEKGQRLDGKNLI